MSRLFFLFSLRALGSPKFNRKILAIAWPVMLSSFSQMLLVNIDFFLVGQISTEALAAVGLTGTFLAVFMIICGSMSFGLSTAVSIKLGEQDPARAGRMAVHGLIFGAVLGVSLWAIGRALTGPVLAAIELEDEVRGLGKDYAVAFMWGVIATGPMTMAGALFGAYTRTRHVMISSLIMLVVNVLGDIGLIFGKFGLPELGVRGAGLASALAVTAAAIYLLTALVVLRRPLRLSLPRSPRLFAQTVQKVVLLGISSTTEWLLWLSGMTALTVMLSPAGTVHLALFHVAVKVQGLLLWGGKGFAMANNAMIGRAHGGRQHTRVGLWHHHNLRLGYLSMLPGLLLLTLLPAQTFGIFMDLEELRQVGEPIWIGLATFGIMILRMTNTLIGSTLRSIGVVRFFMVLLVAALILTVAGGYGMITLLGWGAWGALAGQAIDEGFRGATSGIKLRGLLHNGGAELKQRVKAP